LPDFVITLLTVIHVLTCILIILIVLVQGGDNVDIAAAFGGASQTAFGPRGSVTVLHKATWILGAVFVLTSLTLGVWSSRGPSGPVLEGGPVQSQEVPVEPETPDP
jgi:preprotein translocase subunit SecG